MQDGGVLHGRYRILNRLGGGRFSEVFLVFDEKTGERRVLKRISPERAFKVQPSDLDVLSSKTRFEKVNELFRREAAVLSQLDHPGIPKYVDFFTIEDDGRVELCLVQEYVEGQTLAQFLETERLDEKRAIKIARQTARILAYLHGLSPAVIHRDIKPSNLMVTPDGELKLIDFGAVADALDPHTGGSTVIGTFGYMPLEQYEGMPVPASDIYALGATLVHLLSRKGPTELNRRQMRLQFREWINVSPAFADLLERMLSPDPEQRPKDGQALLDELDALRPRRRGRRRRRREQTAPAEVVPAQPARPRRARSNRSPAWVFVAVAGAFVAAAVAALAITGKVVLPWFAWMGAAMVIWKLVGGRSRRRRRRNRWSFPDFEEMNPATDSETLDEAQEAHQTSTATTNEDTSPSKNTVPKPRRRRRTLI